MPTFDCGHGCAVTCPDGGACLYCHDNGDCMLYCVGDPDLPATSKKANREDRVTFCVQGMRLSDIAVFLDRFLPDKIAIPAARAYTRVSLEVKDTPLAEVVESLGLVIA
jgi:hypothetical protein